MENITLGQIVSAIGMITVIVGAFLSIYKIVKKAQDDRILMHENIKTLGKKIEELNTTLNEKIDKNEFNHVKSALINYMCMAEEYSLSEEQRKNAHELYDWYIKHNGNSYVKEKWEKLVEEGKI